MANQGFAGLRVLTLESRRAQEMAKLITNSGGAPVVAPSMREVPLESNTEALQFASEGQQRTVALALKIAQAQLFAQEEGVLPLLLIDDIFGELDPVRRNALLVHLPADAQKLVTATSMDWHDQKFDGPVLELRDRGLVSRQA